MADGHCDCGERCSCPPGSDSRARCTCWHEGAEKPEKVYGVLVLEKSQKPLIEKHCFGDCGKISMAGAIHDDLLGGLMVCCEKVCPWMFKQMDEPYGNTMSFGRPHEVYLRTLTDTPAKPPYCAKLAGPCPDGCAPIQLVGCGGGIAGDCWRVKP